MTTDVTGSKSRAGLLPCPVAVSPIRLKRRTRLSSRLTRSERLRRRLVCAACRAPGPQLRRPRQVARPCSHTLRLRPRRQGRLAWVLQPGSALTRASPIRTCTPRANAVRRHPVLQGCGVPRSQTRASSCRRHRLPALRAPCRQAEPTFRLLGGSESGPQAPSLPHVPSLRNAASRPRRRAARSLLRDTSRLRPASQLSVLRSIRTAWGQSPVRQSQAPASATKHCTTTRCAGTHRAKRELETGHAAPHRPPR
jgi:hypothetical protein